MQQELIVGDTLNFLTAAPDYPATDGWSLHFRLVPRTAVGTVITLDAVAEGENHRTNAPASVTTGWLADRYTWSSWATKGDEAYTIDSGQITLKPDPRSVSAGYDGRSLAQKTLDDLRAAFSTFSATNGTTRSYKIADRERVFSTAAEILIQISYWEREVTRETNAALALAGKARGGRFYFRQTR